MKKTDNQIIAEFMGYPNIANDLDKRVVKRWWRLV